MCCTPLICTFLVLLEINKTVSSAGGKGNLWKNIHEKWSRWTKHLISVFQINMPEILKTRCRCGDCGVTRCMCRTTRSCADLHGLLFPAVPKTAVGIACDQNKAVFLSLPACLPVSSVILQQNDFWSQSEQKDKGYWPERIWRQLWWLPEVLKWFFFFSTRATWELCERGSLTTEVLSRHCRYIDGFETACEASYPEIKKKTKN